MHHIAISRHKTRTQSPNTVGSEAYTKLELLFKIKKKFLIQIKYKALVETFESEES